MVAALTNGTVAFFFITLAMAIGGFLFGKARRYNRDNIECVRPTTAPPCALATTQLTLMRARRRGCD